MPVTVNYTWIFYGTVNICKDRLINSIRQEVHNPTALFSLVNQAGMVKNFKVI